MKKPERSIYAPQDFAEWRASGALDLTPKFQRRGVWSPSARSFFVDTLLRSMPIPPIYIRVTQHEDRSRMVRQVVDGQQRLACVLDFLDGKFRLAKSLNAPWAGKTYAELSVEQKALFNEASFSAEIFRGISDMEVLEIFARLNTYSVSLNSQELRNGKWFGHFKQSAYGLAHEHLEFWRRNQIFSERSIARMLEVELTSELLVAHIGGMQDKKKSIDDFYERFDESFPAREITEGRFREIVDTIGDVLGEALREMEFRRVPLFYTLYCVILHRMYGIPSVDLPRSRSGMTRADRESLGDAVAHLSDVVSNGRDGGHIPRSMETFVAACLRQTDNIKPRLERFRTLYSKAFVS